MANVMDDLVSALEKRYHLTRPAAIKAAQAITSRLSNGIERGEIIGLVSEGFLDKDDASRLTFDPIKVDALRPERTTNE